MNLGHDEKPSLEECFEHFGVKGMRWGVHKTRESASNFSTPGVKMSSDGSISIKKGANLQRLVRSDGNSLPMKDITFASLNQYDNARYVKIIGGKGFFGGGRDQILEIRAIKPIKAPSKTEATRIVSNLMISDPKFREQNTDMLDRIISTKELDAIKKEPTGSIASTWYEMTNQKMTFDGDFDPTAPAVQKILRETLKVKGFNALRDENDFTSGVAKAPIIIFNPKDSLKVTGVKDITDTIRKSNKEQLKKYKRSGKTWVDSQLYSD